MVKLYRRRSKSHRQTRSTTSLRDLNADYPILLFDTSALMWNGKVNSQGPAIRFKNGVSDTHAQLVYFLIRAVSEGIKINMTRRVSGEYLFIPNHGEIDEFGSSFEFQRRRRLVDLISEKGGVIELNPKEKKDTRKFYKKNYGFVEKGKLSEHDLDYLAEGRAIYLNRGKVCLVSNDRGIAQAWGYVIQTEGFNPREFAFFRRVNKSDFRRWYV